VPPDDLPFGVAEMPDAVGRPVTALDVGCGSGRLTVVLAQRGAAMTGLDMSDERLARARARADAAAVEVEWVHADMDEPLPFPDARFGAVVSRLSLMLSRDPDRLLRDAARVLLPEGVVVTAVGADIAGNPWFGEPRVAVAEVLGAEAASFARAFGRLDHPAQLKQLHCAAGFRHVEGWRPHGRGHRPKPAEHWAFLANTIDHYTRLDASLVAGQIEDVTEVLARRLEPFRHDGELHIPRRIVLVSARL